MTKLQKGYLTLSFDLEPTQNPDGLFVTARDIESFRIYVESEDISAITNLLQPALNFYTLVHHDFQIKRMLTQIQDNPNKPGGREFIATIIPE